MEKSGKQRRTKEKRKSKKTDKTCGSKKERITMGEKRNIDSRKRRVFVA
jgi:hypothetical protein